MNKVHNINLGGQAFTIDDNAFENLQIYLRKLASHLGNTIETDEIINDIEYRIAELFHQNLGVRSIITSKDVEDAIKIMGTVEDFEKSEDETVIKEEPIKKEENTNYKAKNERFKPGRQLFRDPDNKIVGGVCSGIANYLGFRDPIWIRLGVAILLFSGIGFMVYIILWLVIPEAVSSIDKRSMKGEPIEIADIVNNVEDEIQEFTGRIQEWADEHRYKRKQRRRNRKNRRRQRRGW